MKLPCGTTILVLVAYSVSLAQPEVIRGYTEVFLELMEYRHHFREHSRMGAIEERLARHRIGHSKSLKVAPQLDALSNGRVLAGASWNYSTPDWKTYGEIHGSSAEAFWTGLALPLERSADKKAKTLDTLIELLESQSRLESQRLLLGDIRDVIDSRIRLKELDDQAKLLAQGVQHIDSLVAKLGGLVTAGKLSSKSLEPLKLSQFRFGMRAGILNRESDLLVRLVEETYGIHETIFRDLDVDRLAAEVRKRNPQGAEKPPHLFQQIDSVATRIKLTRAKLQSQNELDIWVGLSAGRESPRTKPGIKLSLELNLRFDDPPFPFRRRAFRQKPQLSDVEIHQPGQYDSRAFVDSIDGFRGSLERVEQRVLEEISLGAWESVHSLSLFIDEYFEQGLQLTRLDGQSLTSAMSSVRTLADLPPLPEKPD